MYEYIAPQSVEELFVKAEKESLYLKLIDQLNKDFNFANEPFDVPQNISPSELRNQLKDKIYRLILYKYTELLNLLYIIDVPEQNVKQLDGNDTLKLAEQIAFLVLKREWMKVWFRNHY